MADVQAAIGSARKHNLSVSVRSGGYDWAGRSVRDGGIVIDLSAMRRVTVDAQARTAKLQGGSTAADTLAAAEAHGLTAVTGTIGNIGMAGFTLAGGYGPLSPHYGLGLDNLLAAEVVLADGRCVTTSDTQNPELFWALRGGGGNFGVVTAMTIRLHPVAQVLAGKILFPWSDATAVLTAFGEIAASAKDALAITVALVCSPDGSPAVVVAPCWSGDIAHGESVMAKVASLGSPLMTNIAPMPCSALFNLFEPSAPPGRRYAQQTRWLPGLTHAAAKTRVGIGDGTALPRTSPLSVVHFSPFMARHRACPRGQRHSACAISISWSPSSQHGRVRAMLPETTRNTGAGRMPFRRRSYSMHCLAGIPICSDRTNMPRSRQPTVATQNASAMRNGASTLKGCSRRRRFRAWPDASCSQRVSPRGLVPRISLRRRWKVKAPRDHIINNCSYKHRRRSDGGG